MKYTPKYKVGDYLKSDTFPPFRIREVRFGEWQGLHTYYESPTRFFPENMLEEHFVLVSEEPATPNTPGKEPVKSFEETLAEAQRALLLRQTDGKEKPGGINPIWDSLIMLKEALSRKYELQVSDDLLYEELAQSEHDKETIPPGWLLDSEPFGIAQDFKIYRYNSHLQPTQHHIVYLQRYDRHPKGTWGCDEDGREFPSMHEAMRASLGLNTVDQLWPTEHDKRMLEFEHINTILRSTPEAREVLAHFMRRVAGDIRKSQGNPYTCREDWENIAEGYEIRARQLERGENLK